MQITYERYLDQVLGGWLGKCIGGTIGTRFEGNKSWIEIEPDKLFPDKVPPNDDLDLQILWLKVIEEKGIHLTSDDLAKAWEDLCWYPFNEYGIFRRNWRLGIHPPLTGQFNNDFWENGMGCPIRSEIWGYVFPGAPDLAAKYAWMDGTLDHGVQSVGAEQMFAAMASMAFFVPDVRRLAAMFRHYLPAGTPIARLTDAAFECYDQGLPLKQARERLMILAGHPEACDSQINVPFTFLGLLYGGNDMEKAMIAALNCGYDTDCTLATAAAFIGQILGASRIPEHLKKPIGDDLVMGIQYRRDDMHVSALARDTARMGVLLAQQAGTGIEITGTPRLAPLPASAAPAKTTISVSYEGHPSTTVGQAKRVALHVAGEVNEGSTLKISAPEGWCAQPTSIAIGPNNRCATISLNPDASRKVLPMRNIFSAELTGASPARQTFGVMGEAMWMLLGVHYDAVPQKESEKHLAWQHHFVDPDKAYLPEPKPDITTLFRTMSRTLGRPAVIRASENEIDLEQLIGLRGEYVTYLARKIICPDDREIGVIIGNTDAFTLWINGEMVTSADGPLWWSPYNNVSKAKLVKGENTLLLKLVKRQEKIRFSLGFRDVAPRWTNGNDWTIDLAEVNPLLEL